MKRKGMLLVLLLFTAVFANAQSVQVEEKEQTVHGVLKRGQELTLQLDPKVVEKSWKDYLAQHAGKVKFSKGVYAVEGAFIAPIYPSPMRLISTVGSSAGGSLVWWSLDLGTSYVDKTTTPEEYKAAEQFLRDFARKVHREDVLRQINEAENVLRNTKSEQDRVVKLANDLQLNIDKNKKRRLEIEAELAKNTEELKLLEQQVEQQVARQELSRQQVAEMEKSVEAVRAKLQEIK